MVHRAIVTVTAAILLATGTATPAVAAPTPPTPTLPRPSSTVAPEESVGGPRLASMGVIADLPPGTPAPPRMRDVSWLVADADTGEVIAAKAPHARLGPASTLKTLTALVLLPRVAAAKSYRATDTAANAKGTRIGLVPGQLYSGTQLFQALLMGSANDAAYLLAEANGGIPATLAQMNAEAARLGAHDTVAKNPAGLDTPGQVSSAYDLALFGRQAVRSKAFLAYARTRSVDFPGKPVPTPAKRAKTSPTETTRRPTKSTTPPPVTLVDAAGIRRQTYDLSNHNRLLWNYPGTIGVKNGWTDLAHRTFIGAVRRGDKTYLVTEMYGLESGIEWRSTARLFDWAFAHGGAATPVGRLVEPGEVPARPTVTPTVTPTMAESAIAPTAAPQALAGRTAAAETTPDTSVLPLAIGVGGASGLAALGLALVLARRTAGRHRASAGENT